MTHVDLQRERHSTTISSEGGVSAEWWAGGRASLHERRALDKFFEDDVELTVAQHTTLMSHKELYEHTLAKACTFLSKLRDWQAATAHNKSDSQQSAIATLHDFRMLLAGPLGTVLFQQKFPLRLHFSLFLPALLGQRTEEQQRDWFDRAWSMDGIIGTYAQMELGHGTFIRGLETRADYDAQSEEFILNAPTLTAYKWWSGGLGQSANMVIIMAQLYIKGNHYGLHSFLVRIRNAEAHLPEPGVDVGEIGPKLGVNGVNNGFPGVKDVRIPRMQMLMKTAQVRPNRRFVKGSEPLLTHGTMVFVRVMIVRNVSFGLLQAGTIATSFVAVKCATSRSVADSLLAVVDGFVFNDRVLGSALGCYDGRVYGHLMAEGRKSPLNQESVTNTFHTHLKPLMQGEL